MTSRTRQPGLLIAVGIMVAVMPSLALSGGMAEVAPLVPPAPHPRLFANAQEFEAAKKRLSDSQCARVAVSNLFKTADELAAGGRPLLERKMTGKRLLAVSRTALARLGHLAFAWRFAGDRKYVERLAAEARAVCAFEDWNQSHFLDTAEMTLAVALALDWAYDALDDEDRRLFADSILLKGLTKGDGRTLSGGWWVGCSNNWNQVCHGGLAAGAAAVRERHPQVAEAVLRRSRAMLPRAMAMYAGGGFPEGPGYWEYATDFAAVALEVLERQFADGAPELAACDGFREQADYMDRMTGPTGLLFNYSDPFTSPSPRRSSVAACWYLAKRFGRPDALVRHELTALARNGGGSRMLPLTLLWFGEPDAAAGRKSDSPCVRLGGPNPVAVLRCGTGSDGWYVGVKGGSPSASHGHMDVGSFVLDAGGVRWACDLGCEEYNRIEQMKKISLWNRSQDSSRWSLFRLGTDGHGTLSIDGGRQNVRGFAPVVGGSWSAGVDLTTLYFPSAKSVKRTFELLPGGRLEISDTIAGLRAGAVVSWNMNTAAEIEIAGNEAVLSAKNARGEGRRMVLSASSAIAARPVAAVWDTESIAEPRTPADSPNPGVKRLRLRLVADGNGAMAIKVRFALSGAACGR